MSNLALNFMMELQDKLTPQLKKTGDSYEKYTKLVTASNLKLENSAKAGHKMLSAVVKGFESLPKKAGASYTLAMKAMQAKSKEIKQSIKFQFTAGGAKDMRANIRKAIEGALGAMKLQDFIASLKK